MVRKPGRETLESGIWSCSHVSVKHIILHSRYSDRVLCRAWSSSNLFPNDLTLPIRIDGRDGLNFLLLSLLLAPALHPRRPLSTHQGFGVAVEGVTGRCCGAAVAHQRAINLGSKGVEIQKEVSARCLTSVEMFLPEFLWA
ncbi:hypothetical protein ATANTOWER_017015 [Ataeniobius toweri]|uniref:Uncharacterized protein n=1 Tax=Ataeniobius toweri TaxID=208326 RepID=A0ABU7BJ55_9TELE|nr:hypothetical protein [Ataeniobius toweri]